MICLTDMCLDIFTKCGIFNYDCSNMVQGQFHEIWPSRTNNMTHVTPEDNPMNGFSRKNIFVWHLFLTKNLGAIISAKIWTKSWTKKWTNYLDQKFWPTCGPKIWIEIWFQIWMKNLDRSFGSMIWTKNESKNVEQNFWSIGGRFLPVGIAVFRIGGMTIFGSSTLGWAYIGFGEISSG